MAIGSAGADSSVLVTTQLSGKGLIALAAKQFGQMPVFWGRYFTSTSTGGLVEYRGLKENQALRDSNICVLPIARQTSRVGGTQADGAADAQANADDILSTFGAAYLATLSGQFYVFLDVENLPALSVAYYTGWAQTLSAHSQSVTGGTVTLTPCVYGMRSDTTTWTAVATAVAAGVPCAGVWIARYPLPGCQPLPDWDVAKVSPAVALPCPILIWQYAANCLGGGGIDCSVTNPSIDLNNDLLSHLILPPDMSAVVN